MTSPSRQDDWRNRPWASLVPAAVAESTVLVDSLRQLIYRRPDGDTALIGVDEIKLIGEYTTDFSLSLDDYYLLLVQSRDNICTINAYSIHAPELLRVLSEALGAEIAFLLANSPKFRSRVMWPPELAERPFLVAEPVPPRGLWQYVKHLLGWRQERIELLPEMLEWLEGKAPTRQS